MTLEGRIWAFIAALERYPETACRTSSVSISLRHIISGGLVDAAPNAGRASEGDLIRTELAEEPEEPMELPEDFLAQVEAEVDRRIAARQVSPLSASGRKPRLKTGP
jgi:hypothetical protein